jgi:hypothetical protein
MEKLHPFFCALAVVTQCPVGWPLLRRDVQAASRPPLAPGHEMPEVRLGGGGGIRDGSYRLNGFHNWVFDEERGLIAPFAKPNEMANVLILGKDIGFFGGVF